MTDTPVPGGRDPLTRAITDRARCAAGDCNHTSNLHADSRGPCHHWTTGPSRRRCRCREYVVPARYLGYPDVP